MPRRFFRKFGLKREEVSGKWFLSPFAHLLHDRNLWGIRRRTVVPAVSMGMFVAFLPVFGQVLVAGLAALALRINIPVAIVTTFVSNPVTAIPMFRTAYLVGAWLLSIEPGEFTIELSLHWMTTTLINVWPPLLLGSILLGALAALLVHSILDALWISSVAGYKSRKVKTRRAKESTHDADNESTSRPPSAD
ncbi:MAG: DUF2062 domain-containing protein [Pseudomonadota bacterium]